MALLTTEGLHKALCGPTIAVEDGEGDSKASFQIFEGILCQFEWFACALKEGRFKEGEDHHLREHIKHLVELWIFGDAYGVTDLQIPSIFELRRLLNWACENRIHPVDKETLSLAYYSTDTKSPVCIIFAEFIVMRIEEFKDPESDYEFLGQYPGFITELYQAKGRYDQTHRRSKGVIFPTPLPALLATTEVAESQWSR
ncbi:hypothetical protein D0865_09907 [Hortaea werneckii]|uniref:Uncharacterized protein n=1 Tax=Hortaea werneckii TaxID=91943 RepID=A0A3M7C0F2_HORWE|nr:hypothetical protein D0865_09907 [Hortaea werneckii]